MKNSGFVSGLVCLFFAVSVNVFANDFAGTYGMSAKAIGMGNAVTSTVSDWSSVYYNISGLGKKPNGRFSSEKTKKQKLSLKTDSSSDSSEPAKEFCLNQVSASFLYSRPFFLLDINRPDVRSNEDIDAKIAVLGATLDINTIVSVPSWLISTARVGIGAGIPAGSATKINDVSQEAHNFLAYGREAEQAVVLAGLGLGFLDDLFGIGFGVNMGFGGEGQMRMDDLELGSGEQTPTAQAKIDLKTSPSIIAGVYFRPGKLFPVLDTLEVGLAFKQEKATEIEGIPAAAVTKVGSLEMTMLISALESYTPDTWTIGFSYKWWIFNFGLDLEYQRWSGYRVSKGAKEVYAVKAAAAGSEGYLYKLPELDDIFVVKLGTSVDLFEWLTVRGGYIYQPSFVPAEKIAKTRFNYMDNNKHILSLGATYHFPKLGFTGGPVDITAAFQAQFLEETKIDKKVPVASDPDYTYGGWCPTVIVEVSMKI